MAVGQPSIANSRKLLPWYIGIAKIQEQVQIGGRLVTPLSCRDDFHEGLDNIHMIPRNSRASQLTSPPNGRIELSLKAWMHPTKCTL